MPPSYQVVTAPTETPNSISFEVIGDPQALRRHLFDSRRGGHFYNPDRGNKRDFREAIQAVVPRIVFPAGQFLRVNLEYHMKRPNDHFRARQRGSLLIDDVLDHEVATLHKRDLDNMIKFTLDCLQGTIFANDGYVKIIHAMKDVDSFNNGMGRTVITDRRVL
jgi:Holliday junction resolvase RusA-like endonuclease